MKLLLVLSVAWALSEGGAAAPADAAAGILRSQYDIGPEGDFLYQYETANGIAAQAQGYFKKGPNQEASLEVQGAYHYSAPGGDPVDVAYVANEFGYQPSGSVLPTPPPTPDYIERALAYIAAHAQLDPAGRPQG